MAYEVEYSFQEFKKRSYKKKNSLHALIAAMLLAAVILGARLGGGFLEIMILGRHRNISLAVSQMVSHLRDGMDFDEAVYVFCEEITNEKVTD